MLKESEMGWGIGEALVRLLSPSRKPRSLLTGIEQKKKKTSLEKGEQHVRLNKEFNKS